MDKFDVDTNLSRQESMMRNCNLKCLHSFPTRKTIAIIRWYFIYVQIITSLDKLLTNTLSSFLIKSIQNEVITIWTIKWIYFWSTKPHTIKYMSKKTVVKITLHKHDLVQIFYFHNFDKSLKLKMEYLLWWYKGDSDE